MRPMYHLLARAVTGCGTIGLGSTMRTVSRALMLGLCLAGSACLDIAAASAALAPPVINPSPVVSRYPVVPLSGSGDPGNVVSVSIARDDDLSTPVPGSQSQLPVDERGIWYYNTPALADGMYTMTAVQTDAGGNASPPGTGHIQIDTTAPSRAVVTSIDILILDGGRVTAHGRAEPDGWVQLYVDGAFSFTDGVNSSGEWAVTSRNAVAPGDHSLYVIASDQAGNVAEPSASFVFGVLPSATSSTTPASVDPTTLSDLATSSLPSDLATSSLPADLATSSLPAEPVVPPGGLPNTGRDATAPAAGAIVAIALGFVCVAVGRRPRRLRSRYAAR